MNNETRWLDSAPEFDLDNEELDEYGDDFEW